MELTKIPADIHVAGPHSSEDIHRALFAKPPKRRTLAELKRGIAQYMRDKHRP